MLYDICVLTISVTAACFILCGVHYAIRYRYKKYTVKRTGCSITVTQSIEDMHFDDEGRCYFDHEVYRS